MDSRASRYLQNVLALDPQDNAAGMLQLRRDFLEPAEIVMAETADDDGKTFRTRMQRRVNELRRHFWRLENEDLHRRLEMLERAATPETAIAAARLKEVARQRDDLRKLRVHHWSDDRFVDILMKILIAPPVEANRLREREYRWMRTPVDSGRYESARLAIQGTTRLIRAQYPAIFELEETWLTEILEYNPVDEQKNETSDTVLGCGVLLGIALVIFTIYQIVTWIF